MHVSLQVLFLICISPWSFYHFGLVFAYMVGIFLCQPTGHYWIKAREHYPLKEVMIWVLCPFSELLFSSVVLHHTCRRNAPYPFCVNPCHWFGGADLEANGFDQQCLKVLSICASLKAQQIHEASSLETMHVQYMSQISQGDLGPVYSLSSGWSQKMSNFCHLAPVEISLSLKPRQLAFSRLAQPCITSAHCHGSMAR